MAAAHGSYYVPHRSYWPMFGAVGLTAIAIGASTYLQGAAWGLWILLAGAAVIVFMMAGWFSNVVHESLAGLYSDQMDRSFRWGMIWFIFSEVMFFAAFFGALFYARVFSVPWLGGEDPSTSRFLWDAVTLSWPTAGPGFQDLEWRPMDAWPLPTINTLILLTSGVTITIAHHALKANQRGKLIAGLAATVVLGFIFLGLQMYEYVHAYQDLNLRMDTGIYGSTFFMLTGFHGMHVFVGAVILTFILIRCIKGHFTPDHHFGFEAAAWYWHFVDVVWLGLYIFVYIL
jgi:cytochrome c oxidase subunit III